MVNKL